MGFLSDSLDIMLRNLVSVSILFLVTFIIGKKLISQLNFFDFIVGITIGSIAAALSVDDSISYTDGVASLAIWGLFPIIIAKLALRYIPARRFFDGVPTVFVQNGHILEENLRKEKYHVNDLLEELRLKGVFNIDDVEFAILETSGQISVQLKSLKQPLTPADMNMAAPYQGIAANLIIDGKILHKHLQMVGRDETWLKDELKKLNLDSPEQVLLASLDSSGHLYIDLKDDNLEPLDVLK